MIVLKIYLVLCLIWSVFAFYKHRVSYPTPLNCWMNCLITAVLNFVIFPYAFGVAAANKKIFK
jgi:hypothetical protein